MLYNVFMKISELILATNAKVFGNFDEDLDVRISTDTRTIQKGDFYLPLKGASFDGEKFISQAIEKGAIGAFCTENHLTSIFPVQGGDSWNNPRPLREREEFLTEQSKVRNSGEGWTLQEIPLSSSPPLGRGLHSTSSPMGED